MSNQTDSDLCDQEEHAHLGRLPSFSSAGQSIGGFLAGLEQLILHNRPPAAAVIEEHSQNERTRIAGVSLKLPDDWPPSKERPDRSGARL